MIKANLELARIRAKDTRQFYGIGDYDSVDMFKLLKFNENINIIKMECDEAFSGSLIIKGDVKAILLNSDMTYGRQIFTLAHELYHLLYDKEKSGNPSIEKEANEFASHFIMPEAALRKQLASRNCFSNKDITIEDLIFIEQFFMISHLALLKRLNLDPEKFSCKLEQLSKALGYSPKLYLRTNEELEIFSNLPEVAKKLLDQEKITEGKYLEYLISSGYSDIAFREEYE